MRGLVWIPLYLAKIDFGRFWWTQGGFSALWAGLVNQNGRSQLMLRGCSSIISRQGGEGAMMGLNKKTYDAYVQGVSKKMVQCLFCKYLRNQVSDFQSVFFSWKLRSICKFWIQSHFCAILGGQDIYETECGSETDQFIFMLSHSGLKTWKCVQSSAKGPKTWA